ncbi:ferric reductase-like transmembrane domain-containing protein [Roseibium alexandrii]|uniref:Putative ferric reductase n=1 Tax=Roseibium alexandrii (strain DSM 17067 / NCIMB 14079 / DFL-11) TaxID=244592 RepID=A0A5E8GU76_ROSAD|nr:ferric reductase-like transmembrane domain-containing protein [Roseibium alexandrii]EEE43090.1 putative ferric reductase [Roseibium alexandrii DFL-11]
MKPFQKAVLWGLISAVVIAPLLAAASSPLLAWRDPVYIASGFAGILAMALLVLQPLLAGGLLPGVSLAKSRAVHRWAGTLLVLMVVLHVGGLWVTSPPDVVDALLFRSPTPFSAWGVIAMWCIFAAGLVAVLRRRLRWRPKTWQKIHSTLALGVVIGGAAHAFLIEGTMEPVTKAVLCVAAVVVTLKAIRDLRIWSGRAIANPNTRTGSVR